MSQRHAPPPTRFGAPAGPAQPKQAGGYKLVVGAYMHQGAGTGPLPSALAGHAFVGVEGPDGRRQTFGFSPENYSTMNANRDFGRLSAGVKGRVHDDSTAFSKPGVRINAIPVSEGQARAAMAKVAEYQSGRLAFSATRRQCTTFAADVARAAGVDLGAGNDPRGFYSRIKQGK